MKRYSWEELYAELSDCRRCRLCERRQHIVPGEGDPHADIMLIGEGPGQDEDRQGRPFVGRSGQLLTRMLEAIDLKREQVYICNVVKCRPPGNRTPEPDEASACIGFLRAQFALVRPKIILLLGKTASRYVLNQEVFIGRDHGRWVERKGVWMMPTYHPSALLRDPALKRAAWEDFQSVQAKWEELSNGGGREA
ncbi:MAG: uracil-DNA glycosylase [Clostridia bacterium]|nr:uracil-DNA glycosylase [Clostridia bacterium]